MRFRYAAQILERYPQVAGGVILAGNLANGITPGWLLDAYRNEQRAVRARVGETPLSQIPALAAWRAAFRDFGVDPTQYRSAAEALLRRLVKTGEIPSVNALVDLCNMVSIRYALPIAAFDLRAVQGGVTVRFASGEERYTPLGQVEVEHPEPGEVVFADDKGMVVARRWCWRQSEESATREDTEEILITIEAQHVGGRADVEAAVEDTVRLLSALGARSTQTLLDRAHPEAVG